MTNAELISKLEQAQRLLSDVYHWADTPMTLVRTTTSNGFEGKTIRTNSEVASQMSMADSCIIDALEALDWNRGID
jgi:hypothetical protein